MFSTTSRQAEDEVATDSGTAFLANFCHAQVKPSPMLYDDRGAGTRAAAGA